MLEDIPDGKSPRNSSKQSKKAKEDEHEDENEDENADENEDRDLNAHQYDEFSDTHREDFSDDPQDEFYPNKTAEKKALAARARAAKKAQKSDSRNVNLRPEYPLEIAPSNPDFLENLPQSIRMLYTKTKNLMVAIIKDLERLLNLYKPTWMSIMR